MPTLVVTLTYDTRLDNETLIAMADALEPIEGSVGGIPGSGVAVTVWVEVDDVAAALQEALAAATAQGLSDPVEVEILTEGRYTRRDG